MGDVGAVATLLDDLFKFATEPGGFQGMSLDSKLKVLKDAANKAIDACDFQAVDRLNAEYQRLSSDIL